MTKLIRGILAAAVVFAALPLQGQGFTFETVNFSNLMAPVTRPYVAPGKMKEYFITGKWLMLVTKITIDGVDQPAPVDQRTVPNALDPLKARIKVQLTGKGDRRIVPAIVTFACPPLTDCVPTRTFQVQVLRVGTLTGIDPQDNVAASQNRHFKISGTGLDDATVFLFRTDLKNITNVTNAAGSLDFDAYTSACGTNRVTVRDVAEGGDFYPFPGGLDVHLAQQCGARSGGGTIGGGGNVSGAPDLQPVVGAPVFRHIAANRKISNDFCQGMFAQATTATVKTITVGNLSWGAKNTGGSTAKNFDAQLWRGGTMVAEVHVDSLRAGASIAFPVYRRPQSQTEVARLASNPNSSTQQIYNATGGECVQTVGQATQFDWQDPTWEIRLDAVTNETNTTNNRRTF
ncbi:MAG TPA: hypothetical protein VM099_12910 [Gemmatimonadaceae bacterium]|nr:hypothetical protein [Gemmatimonadaceae bacterium]